MGYVHVVTLLHPLAERSMSEQLTGSAITREQMPTNQRETMHVAINNLCVRLRSLILYHVTSGGMTNEVPAYNSV